jgi:hypothetical protein
MKAMNKNVKYESPKTDSMDILAEGILCASGEKDGIYVDPMDVIKGGEGTDWDWE